MEYVELYPKLMELVKNNHPGIPLDLIEKAYKFAESAHHGQFRKSGEAFFIHPLWVAIILAEYKLDLETIAAALLHDVAEDTRYTIEDIAVQFNENIAYLVDGVTKLAKLEYRSKADEQAENYRKLFFSMSKDIRVILIKIADRLHNMRTIEFQSEKKQKEIAQETIDIYAPLAHRLGIAKIRYELEDISFKFMDPAAYKDMAEQIGMKQSERKEKVEGIVNAIQAKLDTCFKNVRVEGRPKHFFSIYKKMIAKKKTLEEIYDLYAVRVIVHEKAECWQVLGVLHEMYKPIPGRIKDYIDVPKANRYQSLHTTLLGMDGEPFEVQIRTIDMHAIAEYGVAAHWMYKDPNLKEEEKLAWLKQMMEWQRDLSNSEEYIDAVKFDLNVFKSNIYCFTPKGDVIGLTSGSTPIDFAYAVHSAVGNRMVGARVNNIHVGIDHILNNGDRVEIITSQNAKGPGRDWVKLVKTSQARSKINQWFKKLDFSENVRRGMELLEESAAAKKITLNTLLADGRLSFILKRFNFPDFDSLCASVGCGGLREGHVISRLYAEYEKTLPVNVESMVEELLKAGREETPHTRGSKSGISISGVGDTDVRFSKCCSPLPGDDIVGFVTRGRGVTVHRTDCVNIIHLDKSEQRRVIEAVWDLPEKNTNVSFRADLRIHCSDRAGMLMDITSVLFDEGMKVKNLNARSHNNDAIIDASIEVRNRDQYQILYNKIMQVRGVYEIERVTT